MPGDFTQEQIDYLLRAIRGGGGTVQDILDNQAAELDEAWSPQSNVGLLMDGTEQTMYIQTGGGFVFNFMGGWVDLNPLAAGDTVIIRGYIIVDATNYRQFTIDANWTFNGVVTPAAIIIPNTYPPVFYGIKWTIEQTAHPVSFKTLPFGFSDAIRGT